MIEWQATSQGMKKCQLCLALTYLIVFELNMDDYAMAAVAVDAVAGDDDIAAHYAVAVLHREKKEEHMEMN